MAGASFIPYGAQWIDDDDIAAVVSVLRSDFLTQGPYIQAFEDAIAEYVGARYCVAFCNATAALQCAVNALEIPVGSEGITSTNTFVASANCMVYNRLKPVFADIDPQTFNVTAETILAHLNIRTKVLIPVHFAGQPCDMQAISSLAKDSNCFVIEDAAHAIGSLYEDGSRVGNCRYSEMTVFSFHPVKTITTGEGGAVTTNDANLYHKLLFLRSHGITKDLKLLSQLPGPWYYEQQVLGYNFRITDLQCALGVQQLKKLDEFKKRRRELIVAYNHAFRCFQNIKTPFESKGLDSCFHLYVIQIDFAAVGHTRSFIMESLREKGIGSQVHYIPVHTQPWYKKTYGYNKGDCPVAESYYQKTLSLPLYPRMTNLDVERVIEVVKSVLK